MKSPKRKETFHHNKENLSNVYKETEYTKTQVSGRFKNDSPNRALLGIDMEIYMLEVSKLLMLTVKLLCYTIISQLLPGGSEKLSKTALETNDLLHFKKQGKFFIHSFHRAQKN